MPIATAQPNQLTGSRRLTLTMLTARDHADGFTGLPRGTAKPLRFLAAFQEAEPYLGLPSHAFKLVSWLVKQTQDQDWEEGSRPIAWPSARRQTEFLGLSPARVKNINRVLFEAGIFVIRDNEQGKRYGRRDKAGWIIEAYGFDLSPLALRYDEFVRIAAAARVERERMKNLRRRVTLARRAIRQVAVTLAEIGPLPDGWPRLEAETADLVTAGRKAERSEELALVVGSLERRRTEAEQWLRGAIQPVETSPEGLENEPHVTTTNLTQNLSDTVIAAEGSSRAAPAVPKPQGWERSGMEPSPSPRTELFPEKLRLTPAQLLELAPRLEQYVTPGQDVSWAAITGAAEWLAGELGISPSLLRQACRVMGREYAAVAVAMVSTRGTGHFTSNAGGYFAGMLRKFEKGELHLDRTLWRLRDQTFGKRSQRALGAQVH
jgi:replication initiation protein RepC